MNGAVWVRRLSTPAATDHSTSPLRERRVHGFGLQVKVMDMVDMVVVVMVMVMVMVATMEVGAAGSARDDFRAQRVGGNGEGSEDRAEDGDDYFFHADVFRFWLLVLWVVCLRCGFVMTLFAVVRRLKRRSV